MVSGWLSEKGGTEKEVLYILKQVGGKRGKVGLAKKVRAVSVSLAEGSLGQLSGKLSVRIHLHEGKKVLGVAIQGY